MSDEAAALLAELREFRSENDHLLSAIGADIAAVRDQFDEGFRGMDRRFAEMQSNFIILTTRLQEIVATTGVIIQRLGGDPKLPDRRRLG